MIYLDTSVFCRGLLAAASGPAACTNLREGQTPGLTTPRLRTHTRDAATLMLRGEDLTQPASRTLSVTPR